MFYRAHQPGAGGICRKKVEPTSPDSNRYNCRCGERNLPESDTELRFMVNLCISDCTSQVWATMFEAESLFGVTARELSDKRKANEDEFDKLISATNFVSMKFSVSAKVTVECHKNQSPKVRHSSGGYLQWFPKVEVHDTSG